MKSFISFCLALLVVVPICADTIRVPEDFSTIQAGIDASVDGDTILVASGTYSGEGNRGLDFKGKTISVMSEAGSESTVIDCENLDRGFYFHKNEDETSCLNGFTVQNGFSDLGGGIHCASSSPTISDCVIITSYAENGGGIRCHSASPILIGCTLQDNEGSKGGGIHCTASNPSLTGCLITGNSADNGGGISAVYNSSPSISISLVTANNANIDGGGILCENSDFTIENCRFTDNRAKYGGAIYVTNSSNPTITHCVMYMNRATRHGGAIYCDYYSYPEITNSILRENHVKEIYITEYPGDVLVNYSNIQGGWPGTGNIDEYPGFVDPDNYDFHLFPDSPCIDSGIDAGIYSDIDGDTRPLILGFDMGIDEVVPEDPRVTLHPDSFTRTSIEWAELPDDTLLVISCGDTLLEYATSSGLPWLELSGDLGGVLDQGDTASIFISYCLSEAPPGYQCDSILVASNDPWQPTLYVPVVIEVYSDSTIRVPANAPTIQAAIDYVLESATVLVAPGTYTGEGNRGLDFNGKVIKLLSEEGPEQTVIDCERECRGIRFDNGEGPECFLEGFTITGGDYDCTGGGVYCKSSSPTIIDCIITSNRAFSGRYGSGGGIYCSDDCTPSVIECTISDNFGGSSGGGIYGSPLIIGCLIANNRVSPVECSGGTGRGGGIYGSPEIYDSILSGNEATSYNNMGRGGAVYGSPRMVNCLIINNEAINYGGGVYSNDDNTTITHCTISGNYRGGVYCEAPTSITNCILWGNLDLEISGLADISYSNIEGGWSGPGNIDLDPEFAAADDYHLTLFSPCIDAGSDAGIHNDFDGEPRPLGMGFDMGFDEIPPTGPAIHIDPTKIGKFILTGVETEPETLTIWNIGTEDLDYSVSPGSMEEIILEGDLEGTLDAGTDASILIRFETGGLETGVYADTITITSSDPSKPLVPIPVTLEIYFPRVIRIPGDFSTIQAAIDAALHLDTVLVQSGIYTGEGNRNIDFRGKAITVMSENGYETTALDCQGAGRGFNFNSGEDQRAVLTGFTVCNGSEGSGGAVLCEGSSPEISDCAFYMNTASYRGGAIACYGYSNPDIKNVIMRENSAPNDYGSGGGLYCCENSSPSVSGCRMILNDARHGGGIHCLNSSPEITGCTILRNTAIVGNGDGGGIYCEYASPIISETTISENIATQGGGIRCYASSPLIENCMITLNYADKGGGIKCGVKPARISRCIIAGNSSVRGGGICFIRCSPSVAECTIYGNDALEGGGIYLYESNSEITNCILWNDTTEEIFRYKSNPAVTYSDIQGGWPGEGNLNTDPLFSDPDSGDYSLLKDSPCIDSGDPSFDVPLGGGRRIDMGALEYWHGWNIDSKPDFWQIEEVPIAE